LLQRAEAERRNRRPAAATRWERGNQQISLGDCLAEIGRLDASSIDVCVTSPPYNIGVAYNFHDDRMPKDDYLAWMANVGKEISRVLRPDGSFFLNVGSTSVDPWIALEVARAFNESFTLQNHIIWVKSVSIGSDTFGHFKPISSKRFLNNNFESIFHFSKSGDNEIDRLAIGVPFKDKSNISRWGHKQDRRCGGNVWFIPYKTVRSRSQKFDHPSGFPVDLPLRCIQMHGKENAVVLDPFLGAGTTLVAAERLGLSGVGIELDRLYAETAVARLEAEVASCKKKK
jgi:site-specific DNA-methyltransferase (adenine-specific)